MKGILLTSLLSCTVLTTVTYGNTLVPANTLNDMTSTASAVGNVLIENGGKLKLTFPNGSILSNNISNFGGIGDFSAETSTISGIIRGSGDYYKAGPGTTILSANNTFTGVTYVSAGTLRAAAANVLSTETLVYLDPAASFDINNTQQSIGSLSGYGSVVLGSATLPANAGLVKLGGGKLALGANSGLSGAAPGSSTAVGNTTVTYGASLSLGRAAGFSASSANTYSGSSVLMRMGTPVARADLPTSTGNVTVANSQTSNVTNTRVYGGTLDLGLGAVGATSNSTYTGATTAGANTLPLGASLNLNLGGQSLAGGDFFTLFGTVTGNMFSSSGILLPILGSGLTWDTTLSSNGLLIIDPSKISVGSNITGNGGITKTGPGTLTLTGNNSYTGATIVNAGTLEITGGGAIPNNTLTQNGGIFVLSGTTLSGKTFNISGSGGALTNSTTSQFTLPGGFLVDPGQTITWTNNAGTLTFTGSNATVIGNTPLSGSSFLLSIGAPLPLPPVETLAYGSPSEGGSSPSSNGILITGNDNTNQTFAGTLSGNGSVIKVGTGYWNLTGANTYTGLTTVADGALFVNGSIPGDVFVGGGMLGGSGYIGGSVLNQAVVSPGNSPGTLTIGGDYAQSATGFLLIQLASTTVYDKLVIGGQANLNGGVAIQFYDGFRPKKGDGFTFLTAAGGITGQFSQLIYPSGTLLWYGLEYRPTSVVLDVLQGSFAKDVPNLTPNQLAVGQALDRVVNNKRVSKLVDALDTLPLASVPVALEKIVPTNLLSMFESSISSATVQADNLELRMQEIRDGSNGFSANGLRLANSRGTKSGNGDADPRQAIGKDGKELAPAPLSDRWGYFINGSGEFVDTDSTAIAQGTDFTTGGISTGADYRLGDHAAVGLTAGYSNSSTNGNGQSPVKTDSGKLGFYGTVFDRGFFLNSGLGGSINSYDTKRESLDGNALGDTTGTDFNALLGTGYTYQKGHWSAGPIASLRYSWVGIDGFTEQGSLAPLRFGDQSEASLKSTVGAQTSYAFQWGKVIIKPEVRAQWQHEYLDENRSIGASFLPGGAFSVFGPNIGQDSLLLDAGVAVQLTSSVGVYAHYTGDLGRQNYVIQSVNGGVQVSF